MNEFEKKYRIPAFEENGIKWNRFTTIFPFLSLFPPAPKKLKDISGAGPIEIH